MSKTIRMSGYDENGAPVEVPMSIGDAGEILTKETGYGPEIWGDGGSINPNAGAVNSGAISSTAPYLTVVTDAICQVRVSFAGPASAADYPMAANESKKIPFTDGMTLFAYAAGDVNVYYHPEY